MSGTGGGRPGAGRFGGTRFGGRGPGRGLAGGGRSGATAARTPFVVLVVTLLAGGLISLLLLNSAVNQDSFELNKLQKETTGYTDEQQALQQEVDGYGAPGSLAQRARELGMVPGGDPAFLNPDGTVRGTPDAATAPPEPQPATAAPQNTSRDARNTTTQNQSQSQNANQSRHTTPTSTPTVTATGTPASATAGR